MWPCGSRKMGRNLELCGNNPYSITPNGMDLNKEYFMKINNPVHSFNYFSSYQVEQDGRVLSKLGLEAKDVTKEICTLDAAERRKIKSESKPSKQLHVRNVTQLKIALDMPQNDRRSSLSHVTGAIMRNEVAPTIKQLQDVDFVRSNFSRDHILPPLRRKSIEMSKQIETAAAKAHKRRILLNKGIKAIKGNDIQIQLPSLSNIESKEKMASVGPLKDFARKRSIGHLYSYGSQQANKPTLNLQVDDEKIFETALTKGLRNDSVGQLSTEISDQFKQIMMLSKARAEETDKSQAINISGTVSSSADVKTMPPYSKSEVASYKRRHEYGRNLEKNWFKSFIQKTKKKSKNKPETNDNTYDMRLDIFYSPEPEPDEDYEASEYDNDNDDEASMQCGGFSSATTEQKFRRQHTIGLQNPNVDDSQDENDINTDDEFSSGSDIEIILKDDQLIQRRTKHKLKKKRKRQLERYRAFMPAKMETVSEGPEETEVTLTDQEIRAIRLNLRNKERLKKLKGKRRFLQAANAVYIAVQFKNILQKIRKRKLREIRRRQLKLASMISKRVQWKDRANNQEDTEELSPSPKPSLKEVFMKTIGEKLVRDVEKLRILNDLEEEDDEENESVQATQSSDQVTKARALARYQRELQKVSLRDIEIAFPSHKKPETWRSKRRNSIPVSVKPSEFVLEIQQKSKRRQKDKSKQLFKRAQSPLPIRKCACLRHKALELAHHASCQHQEEPRKTKTKIIKIPTSGLMRTYSLDDLSKKQPIELRDLLHDIDIPAKEIKLEILARKFRRQRKKRLQIKLDPYITPTAESEQKQDEGSESDSGSTGSDDSDMSDYDFIYGGPFVGSGVMWNQNSKDNKQPTWTTEDVDRELKRITRVFHEMKECRYLRLDGFNQAILGRLRENSF